MSIIRMSKKTLDEIKDIFDDTLSSLAMSHYEIITNSINKLKNTLEKEDFLNLDRVRELLLDEYQEIIKHGFLHESDEFEEYVDELLENLTRDE